MGAVFVQDGYGAAFGAPTGDLIAAARRTDWTQAGTTIATGRTKSGSTISAYTGTTGTIHTALAAAADETYVELGAGTFNLSNALNVAQKDYVTLRGQGPGVTILSFTGDGSSQWPYAGGGPVSIAGSPNYTADATPTVSGASGSSVAVNGTPARGQTVLNLASNPFSVGDVGVIVVDNEASGSVPHSGFMTSTKTDHSGSTANGVTWQGAYEDFGAILHQRFVVTAVSGNDITISPPLVHDFYKPAQSPKVYRYAIGTYAVGIGLENLTIDTSSLGTENVLIGCIRAREFWIDKVAIVPNSTAGGDYGIAVTDCLRYKISMCWIDKLAGGGINTTTSYGIAIQGSHWGVVENNIFKEVESPVMINIGCVGNAFLYNYEYYVSGEGGIGHHQPGPCYNLFEGNSCLKFSGDLFHGNSLVETAFRNHCFDRGFDLQSYHRYWNIIGNAIQASTVRKTLGSSGAYDRWTSFGFRLGYNGQNASTNNFYNGSPNIGVVYDDDVANTAYLWGNYTSTGGSVFDSSEVPTTDPTLPQTVPANNTLPASLYYSAIPSYFTVSGVGTQPWPLIGPDVSGGDYLSGHAYKTPAQLVLEAAGGVVASFDPSLYG